MARRTRRDESGHSILVVDDQEEILSSVRSLLEREGHRVLTAASGEEALGILKRTEIHLILVDYFMPRMNGEELVRRIRTFDPLVQIILQTGYAGEKPPRLMLSELDIQGYHDKAEGPEQLLVWVDVSLKAHGMIRRLTERERLQAELVANVSHELRTPLNVIKGYTDLMREGVFGPLPEEAMLPLSRVDEASRNLGELVSDFLSYAKCEAGVNDSGEHEIVVSDLVAELERLAGVLLDERDVAFAVDRERAPISFVSDAVKLRTILRNLITNAVKFTSSGSIRLAVEQRDGTLRFAVEDTGPGICEADRGLIFEPFRQIDGSSTSPHGGIGLGLALSLKLARLLDGDLELESEVGRGSTFTLVIPAKAASPQREIGAARGLLVHAERGAT